MKYLLFVCLLTASSFGYTQQKDSTDLMSILEKESDAKIKSGISKATFKGIMLINAHSIETLGKNVLDVKIAHRFGTLNKGFYELFGLDNATMRMGLDYGITDRIMIGVGRSSYEKQYDGFIKYKLLRQTQNNKTPVSVAVFAGMYLQTLKWADPDRNNYFSSRLNYVAQVLIARKFSEGFSLQLSPTLVHHNMVPLAEDKNDILAFGIGGRQKITKRTSFNFEYYYQLPGTKLSGSVNALSLGFDIETGGHVFQLMFTNSTGIAENQYVSKTTGKWNKGDIHFGFNISRVFDFNKKKKK